MGFANRKSLSYPESNDPNSAQNRRNLGQSGKPSLCNGKSTKPVNGNGEDHSIGALALPSAAKTGKVIKAVREADLRRPKFTFPFPP